MVDLTKQPPGAAVAHRRDAGRFERGASRPSGDTLKRLSDALDVTSDYLLEGAADAAARAKLTDRELIQQFRQSSACLTATSTTKCHLQTLIR